MSFRYRVTALCCTTGNCSKCHGGFNKDKRKRDVLLTTHDKSQASKVAANWVSYDSKVEEIGT